MPYDLAELHAAVRDLLVAMRTGPEDYARIEDPAWKVVLALRGPNAGYAYLGPGWAYLKADDRRLLRQLHDALCGREGAFHAVSHPEEVESLLENALTVGGVAQAAEAPPETPRETTKQADPLTDEDRLADLLLANGKSLEAAFVRHFKGRTTATWQGLSEAVTGDDDRKWATVKTWATRVKNALRDVAPRCRLSFSTSEREYLVVKKILPQ